MDRNRSAFGDRYYTKEEVVDKAIDDLEDIISSMKVKPTLYFDFSAGNGYVGKVISDKVKSVTTIVGIDIDPPATSYNVEVSDFNNFSNFSAYSGCIVGFNPPFGRGGSTALKFVRKALLFNPSVIIVILPVRPWVFKGFNVVRREFLPPNSFITADTNSHFDVACELIIAVRDDVHSDELYVSITGNKNFTASDRLEIHWPTDSLLIRKVGHYAGQQIYCMWQNEGVVNVVYISQDGSVSEVETLHIQEKYAKDETPWGRRGHIVCKADESTSYKGSNPSSNNTKQKRTGAGFLKCSVPEENRNREGLISIAQKIRLFIVKNNLAKGTPKSINKGIVERIFMD